MNLSATTEAKHKGHKGHKGHEEFSQVLYMKSLLGDLCDLRALCVSDPFTPPEGGLRTNWSTPGANDTRIDTSSEGIDSGAESELRDSRRLGLGPDALVPIDEPQRYVADLMLQHPALPPSM